MNKRITIVLVLAGLLIFPQCKHEIVAPTPIPTGPEPDPVWRKAPTNPCDPNIVYFENTILKLIVSKCAMSAAGCHGMSPFKEGVDLRSYDKIRQNVEPGNAAGSKLYEKLVDPKADERMPPIGSWGLTSAEIGLIRDWINQGALNNKCEPCADTAYVSFDETVLPLLLNNCAGCHNEKIKSPLVNDVSFFGFPPSKNNVLMTSVEALNVSILRTVKYSDTNALERAMPRYIGKLYQCEVNKIEQWSTSLNP